MTDTIQAGRAACTLDIRSLSHAYEKGIPVLEDVSLQVAAGEVVGLLGRNGSGKTTLLRILAGLYSAQSGSVSCFGLDPFEHGVEVKKRIGYVAEGQDLPTYLSVGEILALHRSVFPTWDRAFEQDLARRFEVDEKKRLLELSKGQARRVALLCAVAHRPEVLLLDEPAGGLDPVARREFLETAIELLADGGSTILFSSHYMSDVERIARRVVLLHEHRILVDEDIDAVREDFVLARSSEPSEVALSRLANMDDCLRAHRKGDTVHAIFRGSVESVERQISPVLNGSMVDCRRIALEEFFVEVAGGSQ